MRYLLITAALAVTTGCADSAASGPETTEDPPSREKLVEVALGSFRVPLVAYDEQHERDDPPQRNRLLFRFDLYVLVPPRSESAVLKRIETHEARLRNEVINTCRVASLEELGEPSLSGLKERLTKTLTRYLPPRHRQQVVLTNVLVEPT